MEHRAGLVWMRLRLFLVSFVSLAVTFCLSPAHTYIGKTGYMGTETIKVSSTPGQRQATSMCILPNRANPVSANLFLPVVLLPILHHENSFFCKARKLTKV